MTACRHGVDAELFPGIWCPLCDQEAFEARLPQPVRWMWQHRAWAPWVSVAGFGLSVVAVILAVGRVAGWWW